MKLEDYKRIVNELYSSFKKHENGETSYDRALEDGAKILQKLQEDLPIQGYIKTRKLQEVFIEILTNKKISEDKSYIFDVKIHQNEIGDIERMLESTGITAYTRKK